MGFLLAKFLVRFFWFAGGSRGSDFSSFLIDRLDYLSTRVSLLEEVLKEERKNTEHFEGLSVLYRQELESARGKIREFEIKFSRIQKWKRVLNCIV